MSDVKVPLDVPAGMRDVYLANYNLITQGSGRLMLFAGDQKMEHLNDDFYGEGIPADDGDPEHLFRIASQGKVGVFAAQLGLITRYAMDYPEIPYLVKMNSKTHLVGVSQKDPVSHQLWSVGQLVDICAENDIKIAGIGYTIYLGSENEAEMLTEAASLINDAHFHGLVTVLWIYPRGKAVKDEKDPHLIAGAAGVAACLGSDFVKVNAPKKDGKSGAELLQEAVQAAGRTKVVCAGGSSTSEEKFLSELYDQIHVGGASGNATGRNIHQKPLAEAVKFCNAIYAITVENKSVEEALAILKA
ncbi:MAG: aldolase [Methanocorpusculum sp.]|jgi:fructose-bisphosphate aldolase/6-deoxy-5-ketofructose 1-phosphate synthase|nr:aldolase [Methanocorpusculum sp.]MBR5007448.1 aldolase [Methanocorpusculum sp.]MBR5143299.1 aldolase [Methanocorpusculum sp.]MBR5451191.1 aldolase [Methanocorpusculum sp.]